MADPLIALFTAMLEDIDSVPYAHEAEDAAAVAALLDGAP